MHKYNGDRSLSALEKFVKEKEYLKLDKLKVPEYVKVEPKVEEPVVHVPEDKLPKVIGYETFYSEVVDETGKKLVNGPWFIKLYAPWCGHCKAMNSSWN
jgi:thiol-disulfide isomerase/thioredoxin